MNCGIISLVTVMQARFVFSSKSRLSVRASHDCDKHEKRQVGGFLIRGTMKKTCPRCWDTKPIEEFTKDATEKDGRYYCCAECRREINRRYRANNPEKARDYRINRLDPEKQRLSQKKYRDSHVELRREKFKEFRSANLDKVHEWERNYRARKAGNGGVITADEWLALKKFYNFTCLCCKRQEPEIKLELDHVLPISKGGKHEAANAQPLCRSCNAQKHVKHIDYRIAYEANS